MRPVAHPDEEQVVIREVVAGVRADCDVVDAHDLHGVGNALRPLTPRHLVPAGEVRIGGTAQDPAVLSQGPHQSIRQIAWMGPHGCGVCMGGHDRAL